MVNTHQINEEEISKVVDEAIKRVKDKIPPDMLPLLKETVLKIQYDQIPPYEAMGFTPEMVEELYAQGYHYFQSGKFKEALNFFTMVDQMAAGTDPRFMFAIAATHHQMKNYKEAAGFYMFYEALHPTDPLPYYYLYDCFKHLNQPEMALNSLRGASRLAAKIPKYASLKAKIDLELNKS